MADPVFPSTVKCDMESVPPLPDGHLLQDPGVADAPDPIHTCQTITPTPLGHLPPCPTIGIDRATIAFDDLLFEPTVDFQVIPGDCCQFGLTIDIRLPPGGSGSSIADIACPELHTPVVTTEQKAPGQAGEASLDISRDPLACKFDFDLDIKFPCPAITIGTVTTSVASSGSGGATLSITPNSNCSFVLGLHIDFPADDDSAAPPPCPTFLVDSATFGWTSDPAPSVAFTITPADDCVIHFALDALVPCVGLHAGTSVSTPDGCSLGVTVNKNSDCDWTVGLARTGCPGGGGGGGGNVVLYTEVIYKTDCVAGVNVRKKKLTGLAFSAAGVLLPIQGDWTFDSFQGCCVCPPISGSGPGSGGEGGSGGSGGSGGDDGGPPVESPCCAVGTTMPTFVTFTFHSGLGAAQCDELDGLSFTGTYEPVTEVWLGSVTTAESDTEIIVQLECSAGWRMVIYCNGVVQNPIIEPDIHATCDPVSMTFPFGSLGASCNGCTSFFITVT